MNCQKLSPSFLLYLHFLDILMWKNVRNEKQRIYLLISVYFKVIQVVENLNIFFKCLIFRYFTIWLIGNAFKKYELIGRAEYSLELLD